MGRRRVLSVSKIVLPTVSWVVMRLLRIAPRRSPVSRPRMLTDMALKAFMGCSAEPQTHSLRYSNELLAEKTKAHRSTTVSLFPGCTSRPHTDSFRVHHVVNQEALQLVLSFHDNDRCVLEDAEFGCKDSLENDDWELCSSYNIIRDGDRLLHDVYADDSECGSSFLGTCSSRLSAATSRSTMAGSPYYTALSRNSVESEGLYSTATSTIFGNCSLSYTPELINAGPHNRRCDSTTSSSISSICRASELIICSRDSNVDQNSFRLKAAGEEIAGGEQQRSGALDLEENSSNNTCSNWNLASQELGKRELLPITHGNQDGFLHTMAWCGAGQGSDKDDVPGHCHDESYEGDDDDEEDELHEEMVAEMRYSKDPLEDFAEAISRVVVRQQLNEAAKLQELYCGFLRLNAPSLHDTITLAFMCALQRLASFETHLVHKLL